MSVCNVFLDAATVDGGQRTDDDVIEDIKRLRASFPLTDVKHKTAFGCREESYNGCPRYTFA